MTSKGQYKDGTMVVKIEGSLSAYEVGDLKDRLLTALTHYQTIVLDINGVIECDTLGIQLLLSAGKTAEKLDKTLNVIGDSQAVQDAVAGVGLETEYFPCLSKEV